MTRDENAERAEAQRMRSEVYRECYAHGIAPAPADPFPRSEEVYDLQDVLRCRADIVGDSDRRTRDALRRAADELDGLLLSVERLRAQRDEARRMVCDLSFADPQETARRMGWDCFPPAKRG